jgi:phage replication O-like protein O
MTKMLIPNSTQVPDIILDHWMAELSGAEFKVVMYIARRTYGFGKERDTISLTQIAEGIVRRDGTVLDRGTGISRASVARSVKTLEEMGIIIRKTNLSETGREFEENTYSINLDWQPKGGSATGGQDTSPAPTSDGSEPGGVVSKCDYPGSKSESGVVSKLDYLVAKPDGGWSQNNTTVVSKCYIQETDLQETDQHPASASQQPAEIGADDVLLSLVQELVSHGVGRGTAERLARLKPEACRRYLAYLPYARIKTTEGAWLANAIRDEYGAPEGYEKAQAARIRPATGSTTPIIPHASHNSDLQQKKAERLRSTYLQLEKTQPEAILAFESFLKAERERTERFSHLVSPDRRALVSAEFDRDERRLELFGRWLETARNDLPGGRPAVESATS